MCKFARGVPFACGKHFTARTKMQDGSVWGVTLDSATTCGALSRTQPCAAPSWVGPHSHARGFERSCMSARARSNPD